MQLTIIEYFNQMWDDFDFQNSQNLLEHNLSQSCDNSNDKDTNLCYFDLWFNSSQDT